MRFAVELADPDFGWAYVIAGWTITGAVVAAYATRLARRVRRAERSLPPDFNGRRPRSRSANRPFHDALAGLIACLRATDGAAEADKLQALAHRLG